MRKNPHDHPVRGAAGSGIPGQAPGLERGPIAHSPHQLLITHGFPLTLYYRLFNAFDQLFNILIEVFDIFSGYSETDSAFVAAAIIE